MTTTQAIDAAMEKVRLYPAIDGSGRYIVSIDGRALDPFDSIKEAISWWRHSVVFAANTMTRPGKIEAAHVLACDAAKYPGRPLRGFVKTYC